MQHFPSENSAETIEIDLLNALRTAQAEYQQAPVDRKGKAKAKYLIALQRFSKFVCTGIE